MDFGGLKDLKGFLVEMFDHKTCIAENDPYLPQFLKMHNDGIIDINVLPRVGIEAFSKLAFDYAQRLVNELTQGRVTVLSVRCFEHQGNSAQYED